MALKIFQMVKNISIIFRRLIKDLRAFTADIINVVFILFKETTKPAPGKIDFFALWKGINITVFVWQEKEEIGELYQDEKNQAALLVHKDQDGGLLVVSNQAALSALKK